MKGKFYADANMEGQGNREGLKEEISQILDEVISVYKKHGIVKNYNVGFEDVEFDEVEE